MRLASLDQPFTSDNPGPGQPEFQTSKKWVIWARCYFRAQQLWIRHCIESLFLILLNSQSPPFKVCNPHLFLDICQLLISNGRQPPLPFLPPFFFSSPLPLFLFSFLPLPQCLAVSPRMVLNSSALASQVLGLQTYHHTQLSLFIFAWVEV